MGEWQPIETAPKDGTNVLIFERLDSLPYIAYYRGNRWRANTFHLRCVGGAYITDDIETNEVTHWMPLPPPPESP